jgi:cell division protease FtsH
VDTQNNNDNQNNNNNGMGPKFDFGKNKFALFFIVSLIIMFGIVLFSNSTGASQEVPYSTFINYVESGQVSSVEIFDTSDVYFTLTNQNTTGPSIRYSTRIPYFDDELMRMLTESGIRVTGSVKGTSALQIIFQLLPWVIFVGFFYVMYKQTQGAGGKAFSFGKSRAKEYKNSDIKITFEDVAGQKEAKYELQEVVDFLKNPKKFVDIGAKIPKGVLLVGLPGTGKTLLAKAVAGEAGVAFYHMSGSDFVEMFVGVGASRVRDLFEQGRKNSPCILFIDELDAVGRSRGAGYGGGNDEREQTLNQMLVEMDGFDTKTGVIVIAATNRPDVLDPALMRPGRFDRQVVVDMPDIQEREDILKIHCRKLHLDRNVDLQRIARATPGTSGADLANLVNEAALFAARNNSKAIEMIHFEEARDKILLGVARKSKVMTMEEKRATAYHEAGHTLMYYYLDHLDPLHKVTIIPHGRALGMTLSLPEKDTYTKNKSALLDFIKVTMGGFVAEEIFYGETTTGTSNDIKQATSLARRMVLEWGMSSLGFVAYGQEDEPIFIGKEIAQHKDYSEETARKIDDEVHKILEKALEETRVLLGAHKDELEKLTSALIEHETLDDEEIRKLLGFEERKSAVNFTS